MKKTLPLIIFTSALHGNLQAQEEPATVLLPKDVESQEVVAAKGWDKYLSLGLYGTLSENENVVGKDDGQSTTLGVKVAGGIDYGDKNSHWINTINILISYSRSPIIPQYIKSEDNIELDSSIKRYWESISWLGLFAQGGVTTAGFAGYDTQPAVVTYDRIDLDGEIERIEGKKRIQLTDGFMPLKFRESFGVLASPYNKESFSWDIKAGLGLRQVLADGQYVVQDNADTDEREIVEIESFEKAGYEIGTELSGSMQEKKVTYSFKANVLFPFYESLDQDDKTAFDKRVIDISGKASFHLLEWASLDYLLTVTRDPGITSKAQVSQSMLFSVNKTLAKRQAPAE